MNVTSVFTQMLVLFCTIGVGYFARKTGLFKADFNKSVSNLLVTFTCPAMVLHSVIGSERVLSNREVLILTLIAVGVYAPLILAGLLFTRLARVPKEKVGVFRFLMVFGNVGNMGLPVVQAIFGADTVFFAAIFQIPFNILCFTYGAWLISDGRAGFSLKSILSPTVVTAVVSFILYVVDFNAPTFLVKLSSFLGGLTAPCAMLLVGSTLSEVPLKEVFTDPRLYLLSAVKLLGLPILTWLVLRQFITNELMLGITVVIMAMPGANNTTVLSIRYDGDCDTAAKGVCLTTLLSVVTIPLLMYLLN